MQKQKLGLSKHCLYDNIAFFIAQKLFSQTAECYEYDNVLEVFNFFFFVTWVQLKIKK